MAIGQQLLNVPMGDMIRQMAFAISDAQLELDESSVRVAELMSGKQPLRNATGLLVDASGKLTDDPEYVDTRVFFGSETVDGVEQPTRVSMMELGFTPTFYQFIDTIIEVKIAIRITRETERKVVKKGNETKFEVDSRKRSTLFGSQTDTSMSITTTPVDATYTSKYSYSAEGSSFLRTKLVPVPPPPVLEDRIRRLMDAQAAAEAKKNEETEEPETP
jgi:hypothetical protein